MYFTAKRKITILYRGRYGEAYIKQMMNVRRFAVLRPRQQATSIIWPMDLCLPMYVMTTSGPALGAK